MFSSSCPSYDSSNLFSTFHSSSSYPTLPFLIDPENEFATNNTTLLDDPLLVDPFPPLFPEETVANLALANCTAMLEHDNIIATTNTTNYGTNSHSHYFGGGANSISSFLTQKPAIVAKKDRHSKIHTSQGLRDRRVRLSSEIARKFFDLQDMLEFDKPSNTLEWLFTKSENAIKELVRSKHSSSSTSCGGDPSMDSSNNNKSLVSGSKGRKNKLKCTQRDDFCVQSKKESRERARARARERTCYKMCTGGKVQQEFDEIIRCPVTAPNTQMLNQLRSSIQPEPVEPCARWTQQQPCFYNNNPCFVDSDKGPRDHGFDIIEESIMIKRNMKPSFMTSHHQNLVIPRDASFNNNIEFPLLPYSTPNWDSSNYCGIATMNLSTCFMNQCFIQSSLRKFLGGVHQSESTLIC